MKVNGYGPSSAEVMLVGEAPGAQEEAQGRPFVGPSGHELRRMLSEAGFSYDACWRTNVCRYRPPKNDIKEFFLTKAECMRRGMGPLLGRWPNELIRQGIDELQKEISIIKPKLIIALGDTALWALTGQSGIVSWRGSQLTLEDGTLVVPTYHPAGILRQWSWRAAAVRDLIRARTWLNGGALPTEHKILIAPPADTALECLEYILSLLDLDAGYMEVIVDIETRAGYTACVGITTDPEWGLVLPYMDIENPEGHYPLDDEHEMRRLLRRILTHPRCRPVLQNGLYDYQYFIREDHYCPNVPQDTMLAQHAMFPGTPKGLDYLASLYQDHYVFWKGESKEWDPKVGEHQLWEYNAKDLVATWEVWQAQKRLLSSLDLWHVYEHLRALYPPVLQMMTLGLRWDHSQKEDLGRILSSRMNEVLRRLHVQFGHDVNPRSPYQLKQLFYEDFGIRPQKNRKTGGVTLNEAALTKIKEEYPIFTIPIDLILSYRQDSVTKSTFLGARESPDGRFRCSFNIGGTETFRFSSSSNAFGEGTNGQNISPVVQKLLIPDPGYEIQEWDLAGADAQVVAWETNDGSLKETFLRGENLHIRNARDLFPEVRGWSDEAVRASEHDSNRYRRYYYLAKTGVHATNYGVQDRTLATTLGISVRDASGFRRKWFGLHPRILEWHRRIEDELQARREVRNAFGFRRFYFDRIDVSILQAALAWIPQSTVAIVCSKAMINLYDAAPEVEMLLQRHDSILMQIPTSALPGAEAAVAAAFQIEIPYPDPLVIPCKPKRSRVSWGDAAG